MPEHYIWTPARVTVWASPAYTTVDHARLRDVLTLLSQKILEERANPYCA